jgi:hypothetical protein
MRLLCSQFVNARLLLNSEENKTLQHPRDSGTFPQTQVTLMVKPWLSWSAHLTNWKLLT